MERNVSFDFFRGIMALLVCVGHWGYWNDWQNLPLSFVLAVDFFLVLSGFVLSASLMQQNAYRRRNFFIERYLRLAPVYLTTVALTVPFVSWWGGMAWPGFLDLFYILLFAQMWPPMPISDFAKIEPLGIAWSLSAELWVGVLLLPLSIAIWKRTETGATMVLAAITATAVFVLVTRSSDYLNVHYSGMPPAVRFGLIRCVMDYSIGILCFFAYSRGQLRSSTAHNLVQIGIVAVVLALYTSEAYDRRADFLAPFLFAALVHSLAGRQGLIYDLTKGRVGLFMGDVSYPLYLIHPLFIFLLVDVADLFDTEAGLPLYLAVCVAAAYAINRLVERPCITFFRKRSGKAAKSRIA